MYRGTLQAISEPNYWYTSVHHFSGWRKPFFRAYCNSWLPDGAYLPGSYTDSVWLGKFNSSNHPPWCDGLLSTAQEYMFWRIILNELNPVDGARIKKFLNICHLLEDFPKEISCASLIQKKEFFHPPPLIGTTIPRWCLS
mmetsp:Transcript_23494/g.32874  ORF Transcript_23494/g.32874 Transcript_23494/m.32874 type:complete len:140 (-) Transcript_23494:313-732(-)